MATFFGLEVVDFSYSADFGNGEITLNVNLVACDDQTFTPAEIGTAVSFTYGTTFIGIVDRYTRDKSPDERYSVYITNGIQILNNVKFITKDYLGYTNVVPNLLNVYGYLGFSSEYVTENGILWSSVASTLEYLISQPSGTNYGGPIEYKTKKYGLDLSELPDVGEDYKITNDSGSIIDFVSEICDLGGHEYYVEMVTPVGTALEGLGYDAIFKIRTIDRTAAITPDALTDFIDSQDCIASSSLGREVRKAVHNKFILGPNVEQVYFNYPQDSGDNIIASGITKEEYANDTILPYFGLDINNDAIIGYTIANEDDYYFTIDVRDIDHPDVGREYLTSLSELRAVKKGRGAWERYLSERNANKYIIDETITGPGDASYDFEPFELPVLSADITATDYLNGKSWLSTGYNDGTYEGIGIQAFGYVKGKQLENTFNPTINADTLWNETTIYRGTGYMANVSQSRILYYPKTADLNPYFGRASVLKICTGACWQFARMFEFTVQQALNNATPGTYSYRYWETILNEFKAGFGGNGSTSSDLVYMNIKYVADAYDSNLNGIVEKTSQIYTRLRDLAENNYNKKFMVSIPFTLAVEDSDTGKIRLSQEIAETGYIDESNWEEAYGLGLIPDPSGINDLTNETNKFYPFVKYEDAYVVSDTTGQVLNARYDLSEISYSDKILEYTESKTVSSETTFPDGTVLASGDTANIVDVWVKCSVQDEIVFEDDSIKYGPRAVIELPGVASLPPEFDTKTVKGRKAIYTAVEKYATKYAFVGETTDTVIKDIVSKSLDGVGADEPIYGDGEELVYADLYAIPLRSKLLSYGPWYMKGEDTGLDIGGEVEYERNDELAPWNFGGWAYLNIIGLATVENSVTIPTYDDSGSVEVLGPPTVNIGGQLAANCPYITNISTEFGSSGVTTNYSFQGWSTHRTLGRARDFGIDRFKKQTQDLRNLNRNYREGLKNGLWSNRSQFKNASTVKFLDLEKYTKKFQNNTSASVISSQFNGISNTVVIQPTYNSTTQSFTNHDKKSIMSLDGLFAPFSTTSNNNLTSMTYVPPSAEQGGDPTSGDLNPFRYGNPVKILSANTEQKFRNYTDHDQLEYSGDVPVYRGVGMKFPMWGTGWGYDTDGSPVPAHPTSGEEGFHPEYLWNQSLWKSGPVDIRWSEERGVWVASGSGGGPPTIRFQIIEPIFCELCTADAQVLSRPTNAPVPQEEDGIVHIYDFSGCHLRGANLDLVDRIGYATLLYYNEDDGVGPCGPVSSGYYWHVISMCCDSDRVCS